MSVNKSEKASGHLITELDVYKSTGGKKLSQALIQRNQAAEQG